MWVWYNVHLSSLSFLDRENSWTLLTGLLLHSIYTFFVITGTCADFVRRTLIKNLHLPTTPEVATTLAGLLKSAWGEWQLHLLPSSGRPDSPTTPPSYIILFKHGKCRHQPGTVANWPLDNRPRNPHHEPNVALSDRGQPWDSNIAVAPTLLEPPTTTLLHLSDKATLGS